MTNPSEIPPPPVSSEDILNFTTGTHAGVPLDLDAPHSGRTRNGSAPLQQPALFPELETGSYQISDDQREKPLGVGGQGVVYSGLQVTLDREVAIKVPYADADYPGPYRLSLQLTRKLLSILEHPNIPDIIDEAVGDGDELALVMRRIRGRPWSEIMATKTIAENIDILIVVSKALAYAHAQGFLHADVKPLNVMVGDFGVIYLIDWGSAKVIDAKRLDEFMDWEGVMFPGVFRGTPAYAAPEQFDPKQERALSPAADWYAVGGCLLQILTGEPGARSGKSIRDLMTHATTSLQNVAERRQALSSELTQRIERAGNVVPQAKKLLSRLLADNPNDRPQDSEVVLSELALIRDEWLERTHSPQRAWDIVFPIAQRWSAVQATPSSRRGADHLLRDREMDMARQALRHLGHASASHSSDAAVLSSDAIVPVPTAAEIETVVKLVNHTRRQRARQKRIAYTVALAGMLLAVVAALGAWWAMLERAGSQQQVIITQRNSAIFALKLGEEKYKSGFPHEGMALFAHALKLDPNFELAKLRMISELSIGNWAHPVSIVEHRDEVNDVAFSPDGRWVLTGSNNGTARVWDAATGTLRTELNHKKASEGEQSTYVAFSPDGRWVLTGSGDHTARVWDATTGDPRTPPMNHDEAVRNVAFSPDGRRVLTRSGNAARVWNAETGEPHTLMKHDNAVQAIAFSPDGRWVLTGSYDHTARVWDAENGTPRTPPMKHDQGVRAVAFSPDGRWVLTGSSDNTARVWDAATGTPRTERLEMGSGFAVELTAVAFSPDGHWVLTGSNNGSARVWNARTGEPRAPPMKHDIGVRAVAFSPDGRWVLTGSYNGSTRVWNAETGIPHTQSMKHHSTVNDVAFSPNGRWVLTGSSDGTARVWDISTRRRLAPSMKHAVDELSVSFGGQRDSFAAFSADGRWALSAREDGSTSVWDAETGTPRTPLIKLEDRLHTVIDQAFTVSPDGRWVLTGSDKTARVWDAATGAPRTKPMKHDKEVEEIDFSPDGRWVLTWSHDGNARVWDAATGTAHTPPMKLVEHLRAMTVSFDGRWALTGAWEWEGKKIEKRIHTARVWDTATGTPRTPPMEHKDYVDAVAFSLDGRWVLTGSDKTARVWDAATGAPRTPPMEHIDTVRGVNFSPDGRWVLTRSRDGAARVWDAATGTPRTPLMKMKHNKVRSLDAAVFSPDGRWVLTGSYGTLGSAARVWDAATGIPRTPLIQFSEDDTLHAVAISPDGRWVQTVSEEFPQIRLWPLERFADTSSDALIKTIELLSGLRVDDTGAEINPSISDLKMLIASTPERESVSVWEILAQASAFRDVGNLVMAIHAYGEAISRFRILTSADTGRIGWSLQLADTIDQLGQVYLENGSIDLAEGEFQAALDIRLKLLQMEQNNEIIHYSIHASWLNLKSIAIKKGNATGHRKAVIKSWEILTWLMSRSFESYKRHYAERKAISQDISSVEFGDFKISTYRNEAMLYSTEPLVLDQMNRGILASNKDRPQSAREILSTAEQAVTLTHSNESRYLETLAIVYGELGRWEDAVRTQAKAVELVSRDQDELLYYRATLERLQNKQNISEQEAAASALAGSWVGTYEALPKTAIPGEAMTVVGFSASLSQGTGTFEATMKTEDVWPTAPMSVRYTIFGDQVALIAKGGYYSSLIEYRGLLDIPSGRITGRWSANNKSGAFTMIRQSGTRPLGDSSIP